MSGKVEKKKGKNEVTVMGYIKIIEYIKNMRHGLDNYLSEMYFATNDFPKRFLYEIGL